MVPLPRGSPSSAKADPDPAAIAAMIRALLAERRPGATICPSEAARRLAGDWRPLMPLIRRVAAEMALSGEIAVTQKGAPVDAGTARGPIRLGWPG